MSAANHHVTFDGPAQWPAGGLPPMGVKRGKDKKKNKDKKKKKVEIDISTPLNVRHVGMQNMDQFTNPVAGRSNFPMEHLATMAAEGQLAHISPYESIRKVRDLIHKGNVHTKEIILSISATEIVIKDGSTRTSLNVIPLAYVIEAKYIQDGGGNVLMVSFQDPGTNQPRVHFFQCTKASAEIICNQVNQAKRLVPNSQRSNKGSKVRAGIDQSQAMRENWILEQRPSSPPPPFTPPPFTPQHMSQTTYTPFPPSTYPPPPPGSPPPPAAQPPPPPGMPFPAGTASSNSPLLPGNNMAGSPQSSTGAFPYQTPNYQDDGHRKQGDFVSRASSKYVSNVHKTGHGGGADGEIKRTIKAAKIQRDVDILNHVFDDLEKFMQLLKDKAAAWTELERKSQKSRRKKNDCMSLR